MFYIIYKITNKINGKIYIGKHQTSEINDGYMGSGKLLKLSIKKYGIDNFEKEILHELDNLHDLNLKEAEIVTPDYIKDNSNYNICPGGNGGFKYINSTGKNLYGNNGKTPNVKDNFERGRETLRVLRETKKGWHDNVKKKISESLKGRKSTFKGKKHTEESKLLISLAHKNKIPWNKGKSISEETKQKISSTLKSRYKSKLIKNPPTPNLKSNIAVCRKCIKQENKFNALYWIDLYTKGGYTSFRQFAKDSEYEKSHVSFSKIYNKYIDDYKKSA